MDSHHDEESRPLLNEHLNEPHYENEDEQENNIITPCKKISKLNKILISVIIGLIVLLSTFVGLFAGAEVNYHKAEASKHLDCPDGTITVTNTYNQPYHPTQSVPQRPPCQPTHSIPDQPPCQPTHSVPNRPPHHPTHSVPNQPPLDPTHSVPNQPPCQPTHSVPNRPPHHPTHSVPNQPPCQPTHSVPNRPPHHPTHSVPNQPPLDPTHSVPNQPPCQPTHSVPNRPPHHPTHSVPNKPPHHPTHSVPDQPPCQPTHSVPNRPPHHPTHSVPNQPPLDPTHSVPDQPPCQPTHSVPNRPPHHPTHSVPNQPPCQPTHSVPNRPPHHPTHSVPNQPPLDPTHSVPNQPPCQPTHSVPNRPPHHPTHSVPNKPPHHPTHSVPDQPPCQPTHSVPNRPPHHPTHSVPNQPPLDPTHSVPNQPPCQPTHSVPNRPPHHPTHSVPNKPPHHPTHSVPDQPPCQPTHSVPNRPPHHPTHSIPDQPPCQPTHSVPNRPPNQPTKIPHKPSHSHSHSHSPQPTNSPPQNDICTTDSCFTAASSILDSIDSTVNPCESFYDFANGGWLQKHPIPPSEGQYGIFDEVSENNTEIIKLSIDENNYSHADKLNIRTIKTLYDSCLIEKSHNSNGPEQILDLIEDLHALFHSKPLNVDESKRLENRRIILTRAQGFLQSKGINGLFSLYLDGDVGKDPSRQVLWLAQDGLSYPDKDYYNDKTNIKFYENMVYNILRAVNKHKSSKKEKIPTKNLSKVARKVVDFEKSIAKINWSQVDSANPLKTYNPANTSQLSKVAPYIDWNHFFQIFTNQGVFDRSIIEPVIISTPSYFKELQHVLNVDLTTIEAYFYVKLVLDLGPSLNTHTRIGDLVNRFNSYIKGTNPKAKKDIKSDCLNDVVNQVGFMAGRYFVSEAFPGESKQNFEAIIDNIVDSFIHRLPTLEWLDKKTIDAAANKARVLHTNKKIGYPTSNPNTLSAEDLADYYSENDVRENDWFGNTLRSKIANVKRIFNKVGKKAEGEWDMIPSEVNAYYQPSKNEIVFPAGILQPPFYKSDWPKVLQYGGAGSVAAHELCHAFDHAGRQYEADGRLIFNGSWWTNQTVRAFEERAKCIINQYNNYTVEGPKGPLHVNGELVIGEAIGDLGLIQAYNAWKEAEEEEKSLRLPGLNFTDEQLFFISFARGWARHTRPAETLNRIKTDPHAPTKWRVDGTLRNTPEFAKAFGCPINSSMNPPLEQQCRLW